MSSGGSGYGSNQSNSADPDPEQILRDRTGRRNVVT